MDFINKLPRTSSGHDGELYFAERIWEPAFGNLRTLIMDKAHATKYSVYPRADKMYYDLQDLYWWLEMKKDIALYETTNKIVQIKDRLKAARGRQKSYADNRRKPLKFSVGDKVLLRVSPWKGVVRFGKRSTLSPRYVGPFEIVERVGPVAYRLRLQELELIEILDREAKKLKKSRIPIVKVRWNPRRGPEFTWEREDEMKRKYPQLFACATA
ncbi:putative reverse transcriptase domain-containing protein [Tanacetum coccineum]